jgi:integrase
MLEKALMSQLARLNRRPQEEGENVARRRFQNGSVKRRGDVWIGRYLEDVEENGVIRRKHRTVTLSRIRGSDGKAVTEHQARRLLQPHLDRVNSAANQKLQPKKAILFSDFSVKWEALILSQKKPSTQLTIRGHLKNYLLPALGNTEVRLIQTENVQSILSNLRSRVSPKTIRNVKATVSMMWRIAKAWGYTEEDVSSGLDLPHVPRPKQPFLTATQMGRIIRIATEPQATFYWMAAETGLRAGEVAGLRKLDVDLANRRLSVEQSIWKGDVQTPKTESSVRTLSISRPLAKRLSTHLTKRGGSETMFVFSTRTGSPWDANMVVKRKLWSTLKTLGLPRCGLHAFRHGNATLMDALGVPLKVRQYRLGHSRVGDITTDVYTHFQIGEDGDVARRLGTVLSKEASNSLPLTCPKQKRASCGVQEALETKRAIGCGGQI